MEKVGPPASQTRVVYMVGSARGGTGILGRVLSTMSGATHGGELRRLWSLRPGVTCDCGRPHAECPIWSKLLGPGTGYLESNLGEGAALQRAVAPGTRAWWRALKILGRRSRLEPSSAEARYLALYCDLYRAFARVSGSSVILDNSKNPVDAALLAGASDVTVYCAHIVRDPRGVLFSRRKRSAPEDPARANPLEAVKTAVYWMLRHLTFDAIRRRYGPERSFVIIYEHLVEDPNPALRTACRLLGVAEPAGQLRSGVPVSVPEVHGPDGSTLRRFASTEVVLKEDDRWRSDLHPLDRALVTLLTFPMLLRYGYRIRTKRPS